jgi:hypothetical protein
MLAAFARHPGEGSLLSGEMRSTGKPFRRDVEMFLKVQRSWIRHPGESRDPVPLTIFKSLGPGFRRDDEHWGLGTQDRNFLRTAVSEGRDD